MTDKNIGDIFNKVKAVTKLAADATTKQAKLAGLRIRIMTLHAEKNQHLQNIGSWIYSGHKQGKEFDQSTFSIDLKNDIEAIDGIDRQVEAIEAQIQAQEEADSVSVKDITPQ